MAAHALWGAIEAYSGKRNIAAGATGAVTGEVAAGIVSNILYDKSPDKLSQEEKETVSTLSQAAAGLVGGAVANHSDGAMIATKTAKGAVENNYLLEKDQRALEKKLIECKSRGEDCTPIVKEYLDKSNQSSRELYEKCSDGGVRCAGLEELIDVSTNIARAKNDTSGRVFVGTPLKDDDAIKIVNYLNERDLSYLKDKVSTTDRFLYQATDMTNLPFFVLGGRNLIANNSKSAFMSAGIGMGVNAGIQYYFNKDVDMKDVISAGILGKMTAGGNYSTVVNSNMIGSYYTSKMKGESDSDSAYSGLASRAASMAGYKAGNLMESKLEPIFNPYRNKYSWKELGYLGISYQKQPSVVPSTSGSISDSAVSELMNKPLSKENK